MPDSVHVRARGARGGHEASPHSRAELGHGGQRPAGPHGTCDHVGEAGQDAVPHHLQRDLLPSDQADAVPVRGLGVRAADRRAAEARAGGPGGSPVPAGGDGGARHRVRRRGDAAERGRGRRGPGERAVGAPPAVGPGRLRLDRAAAGGAGCPARPVWRGRLGPDARWARWRCARAAARDDVRKPGCHPPGPGAHDGPPHDTGARGADRDPAAGRRLGHLRRCPDVDRRRGSGTDSPDGAAAPHVDRRRAGAPLRGGA